MKRTGFLAACHNNSLEVVNKILEKYPYIINQKNRHGWTGFIWACFNNRIDMVRLLLKKHPDIFC